jgi:hypothetical protein
MIVLVRILDRTNEAMTPSAILADENQTTKSFRLSWFVLWAIAWLGPFAIFRLILAPAGYGMFGLSWVSGLFFLLASAGMIVLYRKDLHLLNERPGWRSVLALTLSLGFIIGSALWAHSHYPLSIAKFEQLRDLRIGIARMDLVYYAAKLPELFFQQLLILVLVCHLKALGHSGPALHRNFVFTFGIIHLPLFIVIGVAGIPFIIAAMSCSVAFSLLITNFRAGYVYSFCAHWTAYGIVGLVYRMLNS